MSWHLTKREFYAGLAMQNLQNVLWRKSQAELVKSFQVEFNERQLSKIIAKLAVVQANELIKELERSND